MGITRREFLQGAAAFGFSGYTMPADFNYFGSRHPLNIIQGPTNETTTQLVVDIPWPLKASYELQEVSTGRQLPGGVIQSYKKGFSEWRVDMVRFDGLRLGEEYIFSVVDKSGKAVDQRKLRALDTQKKNARVTFVSCMLDISMNKKEMWKHVQNSQPDVIFLQGDNVYGDIISRIHGPFVLWHRYLATRQVVPFYHWPDLIPAFAVWDDHDFGKNDVDGSYKHKKNSLETFEAFYPQKPIEGFFEKGPGISSAFELFGHKMIFLDGRYFRGEASSWGKGFMGDEQLAWVEQQILKTRKPLWFVSGSQFFGGYQIGASYEEGGREGEFDAFGDMVRGANRPVLFSSGDLHYSEINEVRAEEFGFKAYEMTSSCLHSKLDKVLPENRRRIEGTLRENFMFLDFNGDDPVYDLTCIGIGEKTRFRRKLQF